MDVRNLLEPGPLYNGAGLAVSMGGMYWINNTPHEWYNLLFGGVFILAGGTSWICNEFRWKSREAKKASEAKIAESYVHSEEYHAQQANKALERKPQGIPVFVDQKPLNEAAALKYAQTVQQEEIGTRRARRVDQREQDVAKTLVAQHQEGFKMDISETFWIRNGHWTGTPDEFRAVRYKWEFYNIVEKGSASNSKYRIVNTGAVERIAKGMCLPPPPSPDLL